MVAAKQAGAWEAATDEHIQAFLSSCCKATTHVQLRFSEDAHA